MRYITYILLRLIRLLFRLYYSDYNSDPRPSAAWCRVHALYHIFITQIAQITRITQICYSDCITQITQILVRVRPYAACMRYIIIYYIRLLILLLRLLRLLLRFLLIFLLLLILLLILLPILPMPRACVEVEEKTVARGWRISCNISSNISSNECVPSSSIK